MYRFLIIDDEPVVREGISNTIDWHSHGFELVGVSRDGREGLEALESLRPDVVLTDICMPFVDGLELASAIAEQYPATRTILLTGYDEFEYAQEAIKLKVRDFLLKPITPAELRDVLDSVRAELDLERDHREKLARLYEQVRAGLPLYRERFLNRLVRIAIPPEDVRREIDFLELDLPGPEYTVLIVDVDAPQDGQYAAKSDDASERLLSLAVHEIASETIQSLPGAVTFTTPGEATVLIVSSSSEATGLNPALEVAEAISERVQREVSRTVTIGVGDVVDDASEIVRSFEEARDALEHRFVLGDNQIVTIRQARGETVRPPADSLTAPRERFIRTVKTGPEPLIRESLHATFDALRKLGEEIDRCYVAAHRLLTDTINALESVGVEYSEIPSFHGNPFEVLGRIKTLDEMERWFLHFVFEARQVLDRNRFDHSQRKAIEAVEFIHEHFNEPTLSLTTVCSALAVSKSYFSPIFKSHTGKTFVEYLTEHRAEQAKVLLNDGTLKIYEVAERVGFRDAHYFSLTFKKQTGWSPTEYQESACRPAR
ncbi:MAG: response regulator [Spirochaeta sp.]|jgi:two-component system response regulator YesN|nr:response regulator [Spirochaeta sp.]